MSDFFGEYVAPGALFAGVGISAYQTYSDIRRKDSISRRWRAQTEREQFVSTYKNSRLKNQYRMSAEQVASAFFPDTSRYAAHLGFNTPEVASAMQGIRSRAISSLTRNFGLEDVIPRYAASGDPADITQQALQEILEISPLHSKHMERVARSYSLMSLVNLPTAQPGLKKKLAERAQKAREEILRINKTFQGAPLVGDLIESSGLKDILNASNRMSAAGRPTVWNLVDPHQITSMLGSLQRKDKDDLISKTLDLFEQTKKMKLDLQLLEMRNGAGESFFSGLRIHSNQAIVIDIPIVQKGGEVRLGFFGQESGIARLVPSSGIHNFIKGGKGNLLQSLDVALLTHLNQNLGKFVKGEDSWSRFMRDLRTNFHDEANKLILPKSQNTVLNQKYSRQFVLSDSPLGPSLSATEIEAFDAELIRRGMDYSSGLSPTQRVKGVRIIPPANRAFGSQSFGDAVGDDKTLAQMTRPKVVVHSKTKSRLLGINQAAAGDIHGQIRTASIPEKLMRIMLRNSSRPDIGLHEDVAILLDKNIRYREAKTTRISADSLASRSIQGMMQNEWFRPFILAASPQGPGVDEYIQNLESQIREVHPQGIIGPKPIEALTAERKIQLIKAGREMISSEIVGELPQGGVQTAARQGKFYINSMDYVSSIGGPDDRSPGQLSLRGYIEDTLKPGDKVFGWKRIFAGDMTPKEGRYIATLFESTKNLEVVQKNLALLDDSDATVVSKAERALESFYRPYLEGYRSESATKGFRLREAIKEGKKRPFIPKEVSIEAWEEALDRTRGTQALEVQGLKKIGERRLDFAAQSLAEELVGEHASLLKRMRGEITGRSGVDQKHLSDLTEILELSGIQVPLKKGGDYFIDESRHNVVDVFDKLLLATMEEGNIHSATRWSAKQLFKDLELGDDFMQLSRLDRYTKARDLLRSDRATVIKGVQNQLQFGIMNRSFSVGGDPRLTTGSGRQGSINMNMIRHMNTQRGVMKDIGMELIGRIVSDKPAEAEEIYKRMGAFYRGSKKRGVSVQQLAERFGSNDKVVSTLFGRNQDARTRAFRRIQKEFGLGDDNFLMFDIGDGRQIYHPEMISSQSGSFMTPAGRAKISGIDRATLRLIDFTRKGDTERALEAVKEYEEELKTFVAGRNQAPSAMLSGKVQGSIRAQARPQMADHILDMVDPSLKHAVGIREGAFERMLGDMGAVDNIDDRLSALRSGLEAGVIARQPGVELHRITSTNFYSVDSVLEQYADTKFRGATVDTIREELFRLNPELHRKASSLLEKDGKMFNQLLEEAEARKLRAIERAEADLEKARQIKGKRKKNKRVKRLKAEIKRLNEYGYIDDVVEEHAPTFWKQQYKQALLSQYDENAIWLPKQLEMPLGADFDDDQLDVFLVKDKSLQNRLQERVGFQTELIIREVDPASAASLAKTAEQQLADEDYFYKTYHRELYGGLKDKPGGVISVAEITPGTEEWKLRQRGQALMAELEKGYIGSMTNATDFTREVLRAGNAKEGARGRLFSEMLLGIMPETALKARQVGAQGLLAKERNNKSIADSITTLHDILTGKKNETMTREQMIREFRESFTNVHNPLGTSSLVPAMLDESAEKVIDSVLTYPADERENLLTRYLKRDPGSFDMKQTLDMLLDPSIPSEQGAYARQAVASLGIEGESKIQSTMKTGAATFGDVINLLKKNKKPAIIGTAAAVATSLLFGRPDSISAQEADMAGARNTPPPPDEPIIQDQAPVSVGEGRNIRIKARSHDQIVGGDITQILQQRFPGADVSYSMNDYREKINQEYIRKRLERYG